MIGILLTILKIIGIILLVILGLVLALLLIVLFVPFRYAAKIDRPDVLDPDAKLTYGLVANVRASWLLHLISFKLDFSNGQAAKALRILGIDTAKLKEKKADKPQKPKAPKKKKEKPLYEIAQYDKKTKKRLDEEREKRTAEQETAVDGKTKKAEKKKADAAVERTVLTKTPVPTKEEIWETIEREDGERTASGFVWFLAENIHRACLKLWNKMLSFRQKVVDVWPVVVRFWDFAWDERTEGAVRKVFRELGAILKGFLPKKRSGYVRFGLDDPAATGKATAALAVAIPLLGEDKIAVYPEFEKKTMEGHVELGGRIYVAGIVAALLRLILNKDVKYVIRFMKNKEAAHKV